MENIEVTPLKISPHDCSDHMQDAVAHRIYKLGHHKYKVEFPMMFCKMCGESYVGYHTTLILEDMPGELDTED